MKKDFSTILFIAIFFVGLSILMYPTISSYINKINASHAVGSYNKQLNKIKKKEYQAQLYNAKKYNEALLEGTDNFVAGAVRGDAYRKILDFSKDGMMGYISIKKIDVLLPIYHGTDDNTLSLGAGHLEGTSIPIGGENTHSVITGHRGLPSADLFTDLDKLDIGDDFSISILNETEVYEVDEIKIVEPSEVEGLGVIQGKDYVTLVTCTPYAVNTHRLLVRGIRTIEANHIGVPLDAIQISPTIVMPIIATIILLIVLLFILGISYSKKKYIRKGGEGKDEACNY